MMEEVVLIIGFTWFVGWVYAMGVHYGNVDYIRRNGSKEDNLLIKDIESKSILVALVLFVTWPFYLGDSSVR